MSGRHPFCLLKAKYRYDVTDQVRQVLTTTFRLEDFRPLQVGLGFRVQG